MQGVIPIQKKLIAWMAVLCLLLCSGCAPKTTAPSLPGEFPMELLFASGSGAWGTRITLHADGSFSGEFHDSNMGETGTDHPNGTVYFCSFSGQFTIGAPSDPYSRPMTLTQVTAEPTPKEQIKDGVLYVTAGPYGLYNDYTDGSMSRSFVLYTPDTPVEGLNEAFLSWWPGRFEENPPDTLSCHALWNTETGTGFFTLDRFN